MIFIACYGPIPDCRGDIVNLLHLKYAVEIAKTRSISKAAENLYMGQPNLSRAIRELEDSLGISIFNRTSKGISITPEGEEFLQYARRIIQQVDEVEQYYRSGKRQKQRFSVCVPRASYIAFALTAFVGSLSSDLPLDIFYKETNAANVIRSVTDGDCGLGIVRYQSTFDPHFRALFKEKNLVSETITDFTYQLLMSHTHPLANRAEISIADLGDFTEIAHADPYVPSMPLVDVKKEELSQFVDRHIYVFERSSQFELLEQLPSTFMWVSSVPPSLREKYGLVQRSCRDNNKVHKDVLIYRKSYQLTALDQAFITAVCDAKRRYIEPNSEAHCSVASVQASVQP